MRILIDAGLSAKRVSERLRLIGVDPQTINGIIVTHEHADHICGIGTFSRKYRVPVFVNHGAADFIDKPFGLEIFATGQLFMIGGMSIAPFSIVHDAADPVGFVIHGDGAKFAQATDLGRVTPLVTESLRGANAIVLESNHDQQMLRDCGYPWVLKQRIASTHGHLSNDDAGALIAELDHPELFHIVLGHLSENSNTPERALETAGRFIDPATFLSFVCASVERSTPLYAVEPRAEQLAV